MSGMMRLAAQWLMRAAESLMPRHLSTWSRAMACELAEIPRDRTALAFAVGCLWVAITLALGTWLATQQRRFTTTVTASARSAQMMNRLIDRPRNLGVICATVAVGLGLAYMGAGGAPASYLLVNVAALVLGATAWLALGRTASVRLAESGSAVLALALLLLATALFGAAADGVSRWVIVGPLSIQVSLIVLPAMIVLYARRADTIGTIGMSIAALALAAQPDRAMAGVLAAGLAAIVVAKRDRLTALALAVVTVAFVVTLIRPDTSPAVPFVDRILYTAFSVHALAGMAVVTGCSVLILPALAGAMRSANQRSVMMAFGATWSGVVAAAALGNYPTPLVGYSGSAVLGYLLSVALLPRVDRLTAGLNVDGTARAIDSSAEDGIIASHIPKLA
ncbi:hypothetical protein [Sphingomonas sp. AX6]|uniref:hypothetical protein n=1 Tax=Sphingomonas sp. AX6 TaxID=2653171 RepID=UPI00135BBA34|nr:hypothetical protein [Sphingomonas sp. AX6]